MSTLPPELAALSQTDSLADPCSTHTRACVALACPGVDYVMPLPVTQPWQETPARLPDHWPGWYARR